MNENEWQTVMDSPFFVQLRKEAEILEEGGEIMTVNGSAMGQAIWNLILTKRDLTLWTQHKIKPTRSWKVTDVKNYFGIKGTGQKLMDNFMEIFDAMMPESE